MWNPSTRAWTDLRQAAGAADSCTVESLNDFSCTWGTPCYLYCGSGSVGRLEQSPNRYQNKEAMAWVIGLQAALSVTLHFTYFDTEGGWDFVYVFNCTDAACANPQLLQRFSGSALPADVTSSTGFMLVRWESDFSVTYTGWSAEWTTSVASNGAVRSLHRELAGQGMQVNNNVPPGRKDHGFAACQDSLYVFGGTSEAGKSVLLLLVM